MILEDVEMFRWEFLKAFSDCFNFLSVEGPKVMVLAVEKTEKYKILICEDEEDCELVEYCMPARKQKERGPFGVHGHKLVLAR